MFKIENNGTAITVVMNKPVYYMGTIRQYNVEHSSGMNAPARYRRDWGWLERCVFTHIHKHTYVR